jgi:hypothetical protein
MSGALRERRRVNAANPYAARAGPAATGCVHKFTQSQTYRKSTNTDEHIHMHTDHLSISFKTWDSLCASISDDVALFFILGIWFLLSRQPIRFPLVACMRLRIADSLARHHSHAM